MTTVKRRAHRRVPHGLAHRFRGGLYTKWRGSSGIGTSAATVQSTTAIDDAKHLPHKGTAARAKQKQQEPRTHRSLQGLCKGVPTRRSSRPRIQGSRWCNIRPPKGLRLRPSRSSPSRRNRRTSPDSTSRPTRPKTPNRSCRYGTLVLVRKKAGNKKIKYGHGFLFMIIKSSVQHNWCRKYT